MIIHRFSKWKLHRNLVSKCQRARSTVGQFAVCVSPGTTPFCWLPQTTRPSSCLGTRWREIWRRLVGLNTFARTPGFSWKIWENISKNMWKQEAHVKCCAIAFNSFVRFLKIWKSPAQVVLGNLSFSILSIRAHQLGAFITAFWGRRMGGWNCLQIEYVDWVEGDSSWFKFTDFLVHSQIQYLCSRIRPNSLQASSQSCILTEERTPSGPSEFDRFLILMILITCFLHFVYRRSTLRISPKIRSWWPPAERWHGWHLPVQCDHRVIQPTQCVWCVFTCVLTMCV